MHLDLIALLLLAALIPLVWLLLVWSKRFAHPHINFPTLQNFPSATVRSRLTSLPPFLFITSLIAFALAFMDPHTVAPLAENEGDVPREGVAIFFALDKSGSMREVVPVPYSIDSSGQMKKIDMLKKVTTEFIRGDKSLGLPGLHNDLIGVVTFARAAYVLAPLTLDHATVLEEIKNIQLAHTIDTDGTSIGYAIYKTASMIAATRSYAQEMATSGKAPYQIKGSAIIVVTDGLQEPSPLDKGKRLRNMDIPEAAAYAKQNDIRLFIVNVDPGITSDEFQPHRHIMERATELTGGKFLIAGAGTSLREIYQQIGTLTKGTVAAGSEKVIMGRHLSFYPWFLAIGLLCLLAAVLLETVVMRRVP